MKRIMSKTIIAIDPDSDKSGVAIIEDSRMRLACMTFADLLTAIKETSAIIYIEAGWLISHNWHTKLGESASVSAKKGYAVGRNHETGRKIEEICKHFGKECHLVKPLRKCWRGAGKKITNDEFQRVAKMRGVEVLKTRTNQDERDAGLIALTRW